MIQSATTQIMSYGTLEGQMRPWPNSGTDVVSFADTRCRTAAYRTLASSTTPTFFVAGIGYSLPSPDKWLSNGALSDLHKLNVPADSSDTFRNWVVDRTGISGRYHDDSLDMCELIINAGNMATAHANSGNTNNQISRVIVSTTRLPHNLDPIRETLSRAFLLNRADVLFENKACSSIAFQIAAAQQIFENDSNCHQVLIIGYDQGSKFSDFNDVSSAILFGDGAGALLLERKSVDDTSPRGVYHTETGDIPDTRDFLFFGDSGKVVMANGQAIFKHASRSMESVLPSLLRRGGIGFNDVDRVILHQANLALPRVVYRKFFEDIDTDGSRVPANIRHLGNTGAASPYLLFAESFQAKLLTQGDIVLVGAVGMGMHYGGVLLVL